jgi:hypothetical protein
VLIRLRKPFAKLAPLKKFQEWAAYGEISGLLNQENIGQIVVQCVQTVLKKKRSCGAHVFIQGVPFKMQFNLFILLSN